MRIVLIADAFPPMRTSAAVQMRDLAQEFRRQGHRPTVLVPTAGLGQAWSREEVDGVEVVRLKAPQTKDVSHLKRTLGEFVMPFAMLRNLRRSPLATVRWDGVVWYSPSIFFGPLARALKKTSGCRSYLIVRDIFPEWAVDMGLMGRGLPYYCFKMVERYQYSVADGIGVQTPANLGYFHKWTENARRRVEVLQNWLAPGPDAPCSIRVADSPLAGRKVFVYAGNMGVAQGMDILIGLAERLRGRKDIGFLFVGRGSEARRLRDDAKARKLDNMMFHDEVDPSEIAGLYAQCHVGIVALDPRHKTHNVPGKFLSYMQAGLPVLANVNAGNDLIGIIEREQIGSVCTDHRLDTLEKAALQLLDHIAVDSLIGERCRTVSMAMFSPAAAVNQVIDLLAPESGEVQVASTPARPVARNAEDSELQREQA